MTDLFHTTMTALEQSLTCELIASKFPDDGILPLTSDKQEIIAYAKERNFTRVPLWEVRQHEPSHVAIVDLKERTMPDPRPISSSDLIASNTPIGRAIHLLQERSFCFVLVNERIAKILTRSDLNKLPVRVYLTTLIAHLEGLLTSAIVEVCPDDAWLHLLAESRQEAAHKLFSQKREAEFDTLLIDCTTLSDKSNIIGKSPLLLDHVRAPSKSNFQNNLARVIRLRDALLHGMPTLNDEADTLRNHLYHGHHLTKTRDVQWLSEIVKTMQQWIDCLSQQPEEGQPNGA